MRPFAPPSTPAGKPATAAAAPIAEVPPDQRRLFNEAEALAQVSPSAPEKILIPAHEHKKRGRKALSPDLPRVEVLHNLADHEKVCAKDGTALERIGAESLSYRYPLSNGLSVIARVDNNYVGSRIDVTFGVNTMPSYDLTNVRLGVEAGHWTTALFINNVANRRALIDDVVQFNIDVPTFQQGTVSMPLTFGVDFSYHFR